MLMGSHRAPKKTLADWHYHSGYPAEPLSHIITGYHFPCRGNRCTRREAKTRCLLGLTVFSWLGEPCIDRDRGGTPAPINHWEHGNATAVHSTKEKEATDYKFLSLSVVLSPSLPLSRLVLQCYPLYLGFLLPKLANSIIWGKMFLEFPAKSIVSHPNDLCAPPLSLPCHYNHAASEQWLPGEGKGKWKAEVNGACLCGSVWENLFLCTGWIVRLCGRLCLFICFSKRKLMCESKDVRCDWFGWRKVQKRGSTDPLNPQRGKVKEMKTEDKVQTTLILFYVPTA